jgi:hypothetical protein
MAEGGRNVAVSLTTQTPGCQAPGRLRAKAGSCSYRAHTHTPSGPAPMLYARDPMIAMPTPCWTTPSAVGAASVCGRPGLPRCSAAGAYLSTTHITLLPSRGKGGVGRRGAEEGARLTRLDSCAVRSWAGAPLLSVGPPPPVVRRDVRASYSVHMHVS